MPAECTRFMLNLMNQWKLTFALCVPCVAVGLGAILIYYISGNDLTDDNLSQPPNEEDEAQLQVKLKEKADEEKHKMYSNIILGNRSLEMGCYDDAVEYYTKYLTICPQSDNQLIAHVLHSRATAFYNTKLYSKSLADCNKVLESLPINKDTLFLRAKVLINMNNLKLAAEDVTIYLLTRDSEHHVEEDVSFALLIIISFDDETIDQFQKTKNSASLLLKQIKQITYYNESFLDEILNAVDPKVLDKDQFKTNMITAIRMLRNFMDKYNEGTTPTDPLDVIKIKNSFELRLNVIQRLQNIPEINETIQ
ncbi:Tetratricopeptide repeat,Tetratricopeptide repeat-containing domain,Tetratricopeptide-like helical [Cinara cedri]|uniref:Tetratricopeptide repeat,Tetratricopeptide repeat-containing domain,Tetratricopeptide-like helical n=1 Tax=Cinara cedri TaxID=506608 RepID=A0A5E4NNP6_9HEMI|nr:Tetratricopeptide repeat,Tetratricopeptide repeat-containing domain,Tetratricopeptide-like helical [Cinara cedri]